MKGIKVDNTFRNKWSHIFGMSGQKFSEQVARTSRNGWSMFSGIRTKCQFKKVDGIHLRGNSMQNI